MSKKRSKTGKRGQGAGGSGQPTHGVPPPEAPESDASAPVHNEPSVDDAHQARRGLRRQLAIATGVALALAGLVVLIQGLARPEVQEVTNALGDAERCVSCHPTGARKPDADGPAHPAIPGHADILAMGCTPCHGGRARRSDITAHKPDIGAGADPFIPVAFAQLACARCHPIGKLAGAEMLLQGRNAYAATSCVGCHHPGAHPRAIGLDLRVLAQRPPQFIERLLVEPRTAHPTGAMWPVTDATYKQRFDGSDAGRKRLSALMTYVLALGDRPARQRFAAISADEQLRVDRPCNTCHRQPGQPATGPAHHCPSLVQNAELRCARCHEGTDVVAGSADAVCPQIRAELFSCGTCHLRDESGADTLVRRAVAGRPRP